MKAKPFRKNGNNYSPCEPDQATHILIHKPGPISNNMIPVILKGSRKDTGCWSWNGDVEKPTLKPSILTTGSHGLTDEEIDKINKGEKVERRELRCHTWITDGKVIFLDDCTHEFKGMTMDLLEVD